MSQWQFTRATSPLNKIQQQRTSTPNLIGNKSAVSKAA